MHLLSVIQRITAWIRVQPADSAQMRAFETEVVYLNTLTIKQLKILLSH